MCFITKKEGSGKRKNYAGVGAPANFSVMRIRNLIGRVCICRRENVVSLWRERFVSGQFRHALLHIQRLTCLTKQTVFSGFSTTCLAHSTKSSMITFFLCLLYFPRYTFMSHDDFLVG